MATTRWCRKQEYCCLAHGVQSLGWDVRQHANAQCVEKRRTIGKKDLLLKLTTAMVHELAKNDLLESDPRSPSRKPCLFMGYEVVVDDTVIDWQFVLREP